VIEIPIVAVRFVIINDSARLQVPIRKLRQKSLMLLVEVYSP
jgi:hypothetical protein